ncbi:MAG: heme exporter protein CcmB [Chloroflexi bacterium]|nr:heme exporter protein CcmB [Chloroflexota bacterium]
MSKILTLVAKDLLNEIRTKEILTSVSIFALLVVFIFGFAVEPNAETVVSVAPGMLWVAIAFACVLGFGRSFAQEKEHGCLDGLMLCPVDRETIYWGKLIGSLLFLLVVEAIILPFFFILLNLPFVFMPGVALIVLLATLGFVSVGTLLSAMSANTRAQDIILPILLFPVIVPVFIAAIQSTSGIFKGLGWSDFANWLEMIVAFDVIFMVVSSFVFKYAVEG